MNKEKSEIYVLVYHMMLKYYMIIKYLALTMFPVYMKKSN